MDSVEVGALHADQVDVCVGPIVVVFGPDVLYCRSITLHWLCHTLRRPRPPPRVRVMLEDRRLAAAVKCQAALLVQAQSISSHA